MYSPATHYFPAILYIIEYFSRALERIYNAGEVVERSQLPANYTLTNGNLSLAMRRVADSLVQTHPKALKYESTKKKKH